MFVGAPALLGFGGAEAAARLSSLWIWWTGNARGILLIVPLALSWSMAPLPRATPRWLFGVLAAVLASSFVGFGTPLLGALSLVLVPYVPVMWAAAAFGHRGASLATLAYGLSALTFTGLRLGPVAQLDPVARPLVLGMLVDVAALASGLVAALSTRSERDIAVLRDVEERLRALASASPVGLYRIGRSGACTYINERGAAIIGRSVEECLGDGWQGSLAPDEAEAVMSEASEARETGLPFRMEHRYVQPDGSEVWVLAQSVAVTDRHGAAAGRIGTITDITEQRAVEAAFASVVGGRQEPGEATFRLLARELAGALGTSHAFISRALDPEGRRLRVLAMLARGEWVEPFEYETQGTPCAEVVARRELYFAETVRERYPEDLYLEEEGIECYAAVPLIGRDGELIGDLGVMHDAPLRRTDRRERLLTVFAARAAIELERSLSNERLLASEARYRHIFESATVALFEEDVSVLRAEIDRVTRGGAVDLAAYLDEHPKFLERAANLIEVVAVNRAAVRLFGAAGERELLGPLGRSLDVAALGTFRDELLALARGDRHFESEGSLPTRGAPRDMLFSVSIPPPEAPELPMLFSALDLSAGKRTKRELAEARGNLRRLVVRLQSVREQERQELAREVHDQLGQLLSALKMDLTWVKAQLSSGARAVVDRLDAAALLLDDTIERVRDIATRLRPAVLDDLGLVAAVKWQAGDFERHSGIRTHIDCAGIDAEVPQDLAIAAFRILQEALTNIGRHSGGDNAWVTIAIDAGQLVLCVRDDGTRQADDDVEAGLGMLGMRERAEALGGRVRFATRAEGGGELSLVLPLKQPVAR